MSLATNIERWDKNCPTQCDSGPKTQPKGPLTTVQCLKPCPTAFFIVSSKRISKRKRCLNILDFKKKWLQGNEIFCIFLLFLSPGSKATDTRAIQCVWASLHRESELHKNNSHGSSVQFAHPYAQDVSLIPGLLFTSCFLGETYLLF